MAPPELSADAPVLNVLQPVLVGVHILLWIELHLAAEHWRQSDVGKMLHAEEPLQ